MPLRLLHALPFLALLFTLVACDSSNDGVARSNSTVTVAYEGRLEDGRVFDQSDRATFPLQGVIPGFRDGIVGMAVGESKTFTIPPARGYGNRPPQGSIIPPNAALTFDVTLLEIR